MVIKSLKMASRVYDLLIDHLKSTIKPIDENINSQLMADYEDKIATAKDWKTYRLYKDWLTANGVVMSAAGVFSAIEKNPMALIACGVACLPPSWIAYYNLKKDKLCNSIVNQMEYAKFLQAMSENENYIEYPFDASNIDDFYDVITYLNMIYSYQGRDDELIK